MNIFHLARRLLLPLMLLLSAFSPLMLFLGRSSPESIGRLLIFPAAYVALAALLTGVPGRKRMPLFAAGCALGFGAGLWLFPGSPSLLIMPAAGAAVLFVSLSYADKSPSEASPFFYMTTLIAELGTVFLLHFSLEQGAARDTLYPLVQAGFVLYLLCLLLAFSRISLNNATLSRYRLPGVISKVCTVLTLCFFALALMLSSLPAVISGVRFAFQLLRRGIEQFLVLLMKLFPVESPGGPQGAPMPMLPIASGIIEQEPTALALLLERAAEILTFIVLIVGTLLLVRLLIRLLVRLARLLLDRLRQYASAVTEDYEDEITDTRQEEADRSLNLLRRRIQHTKQTYPDTPAGEIRRGYARLLRAHSEWTAGSTARENLPGSAAALYERARYSTHPVTGQDADAFHRQTRQL